MAEVTDTTEEKMVCYRPEIGKAVFPSPKEWELTHHWHQGQKSKLESIKEPISEVVSLKSGKLQTISFQCLSKDGRIIF